ncbi:MAG: hypothetical protein K1X79_08120 [Oligoflexia bacterium]|nr:hypothetical protein [Oligoflexia bacterium]
MLDLSREGLNEALNQPHRNTCLKILTAVCGLMFMVVAWLVMQYPSAELVDIFAFAAVFGLLICGLAFESIFRSDDGQKWEPRRFPYRYRMNYPTFTSPEAIISVALALLVFFAHMLVRSHTIFHFFQSR